MKKFFLVAVFAMCVFTQILAYSDVYYIRKTIIQSVQACGPVTVDAAKIDSWGNIGPFQKYSVSSGTTWSQRVRIKSGCDCNDNNLQIVLNKHKERKHYPKGVKYGSTVYHYVEYETYYYSISTGSGSCGNSSSSSENTTNKVNGSYEDYNTNNNNSSSRMDDLADKWSQATAATKLIDIQQGYYPGGFSLSASVSKLWGENLELRWLVGSSNFGFDMVAQVGYDWIKPQDKGVAWNLGLGAYFGDRISEYYLWDVCLNGKLGQFNSREKKSLTAVFDLNTTHLIGPYHVIGLTAGAGIGVNGWNKMKFVWDVHGGIVIYFLQWNWL